MKLTIAQQKFLLKLNTEGPSTPQGSEWIPCRALTKLGLVERKSPWGTRHLTPFGQETVLHIKLR